MKYPALKNQASGEVKTFTVAAFDRGINTENGTYATDDSTLLDCNNMSAKQGMIRTRNGFCAKQESVISLGEDEDTVYLPFTVTDTVYYKNAVPCNLAYSCFGSNIEARLKFYLTDSNGNISPAGEIYIHRVDYKTFYVPGNVFFTVADKIRGCGVFAYVARNSTEDSIYEIYEADATFSQWDCVNDLIYTPTVRLYGRGERYDQAKGYTNLNYPEPQRLEELNLLGGNYKCYFTSDGLSSIFRLPYGNIDPLSIVRCRFYSSSEAYTEWIVSQYSYYDTKTIDGVSVSLLLDRTLGIISFISGQEYYAMPVTNCKLNNIMVSASTTDDNARSCIISSAGTVMLDNRLYYYGNQKKQNCIYCAKLTNPLYIPQSSRLYLGDATTPVTSLKVQNGKLIAFKSGETYRVITSYKDDVIQKEAVLPESTVYVRGDTLSAQTIDNTIGCTENKTICLCGSRLVWLGSDRRVYALATTTYGNTTNIYCVSRPVSDKMESTNPGESPVFAATKDGNYMLFLGNTVFVMNYRVRGFGYSSTYYAQDDLIKSPAWYIWKTPADAAFYGSVQTASDTLILSSFKNGEAFYIANISGCSDVLLKYENRQETAFTVPVESGITTKTFDIGDKSRRKRIDSIFISGDCPGSITLDVFDGKKKHSRSIILKQSGDFLRLPTTLQFCEKLSLGISSKNPFSIRSIIIKYKLLAHKG
ncbi:MAG: hypothetical protein J5659_05720 [Clostridia bacterium]|nr:hypothetical protein [Clostridia bacterium]